MIINEKCNCILFNVRKYRLCCKIHLIRTFIKDNKEKLNGKKFAIFICYMGGGADKAIEKLKQCLEINEFDAELILIDPKDKKTDEKDKQIGEFCEKINSFHITIT